LKDKLSKEPTEWTGERYLPWMEIGEIHYEHLHRYYFASQFTRSKLDLACGEGYGTDIIAENAKEVIGIDIDEKMILHANQKYKKKNLEFKVGSITQVPIEKNHQFDVIVCFERVN